MKDKVKVVAAQIAPEFMNKEVTLEDDAREEVNLIVSPRGAF